ncbi:hypothetical protein GCM10025867_17710 [Frondihabitans sucicola]|uniref:DUF6531 domain-containing protein n=1 Tax=Frondihabitans sucicola TaxID=1268041 RepID=A0ABM8GMU2_9MICO|nr:DUF6531 domain-containing protein [Frondihabitans sucicola]BDZ49530.1 hypothetical protein GCM10025867_17710 [Frondihabitans sucicola]
MGAHPQDRRGGGERTSQKGARLERRARPPQPPRAGRRLLHRGRPAPERAAEKSPVFHPATIAAGTRQTPSSGSGGSGGTSSAKPENLRSFATGSASLDSDLSGRPGALRGKLSDFASRCQWGTIEASGLVTGFDRWLAANAQDVQWAKTIANAFAAAGGEGSVSTISDSALAAALQAAGVNAERTDLTIDPPRAYGAQPTSGYSMDPVNTSTGNFLEPETDLAFAGASASLRLDRMYNSLDQRVGVFGLGWASTLETRLEIDDEGASLPGRRSVDPVPASRWGLGKSHRRELLVGDRSGSCVSRPRRGRCPARRARQRRILVVLLTVGCLGRVRSRGRHHRHGRARQ